MSRIKNPPSAEQAFIPAAESVRSGLAFRFAQQGAVLVLAVVGFLFCLISSYRLELPASTLVWTAVAFSLLSLAVFSVRKSGILALVCLVVAGVWIWLNASDLLQGGLLLVQQAIEPLSLRLPEAMQSLLQSTDAARSVFLMTRALQTILFFVAFLSGYFVISLSSMAGLALSTLPLLLPGPFYLLSPSLLAFFALFAAHLMVFAFNNGRFSSSALRAGANLPQNRRKAELNAQRSAQQAISLLILPLIALAALLSGVALPQKGYVRPEAIETLQQKIFALNIGKEAFWKSNDGLTRGDLKTLSSIRFTGKPALKVRVSKELSLYLRDYAGALYTGDGWANVSATDFSSLADSVNGIAPQNLLAVAATASGDPFSTYELSVKNIDATPLSIWTPAGLISHATELGNAGYQQDTALAFASSENAAEYTLQAVPLGSALYSVSGINTDADGEIVRRAYQNAAGGAYGLSRAEGEEAALVRQAAETYIDYVARVYTSLPDDTRAAALRLCQTYGLTRVVENGSLNLAATCEMIHSLLASRCSYAYSPPEVPEGVDFPTYFLEESRSGYCVHFATTATVLLRALGIPARYAEGYIVIRSDYEKAPDAQGYIAIEDTHAHAWVEVFDPAQLEWIPVEMTTGAADSAQPTPDETGDQPGVPTFTLTEPTPTPTLEPTPTPTATPEKTDITESTPDPTDGETAQTVETPSPAPTETGALGDETATPSPEETEPEAFASSARPPLWPLLIVIGVALVPLSVFIWRKALHERRIRKFTQKDINAAVLAICRYALDLLRFAGAPAMDPLETPEEYAYGVARRMQGVDRERLETMLLSAQRARFSGRTCSKKERDDAMAFVRSLSIALFARLSRMKRFVFRWRFPLL